MFVLQRLINYNKKKLRHIIKYKRVISKYVIEITYNKIEGYNKMIK